MPCQSCDCATDGLLYVLGHPPVVLFLKIADCDQPSPRSNGELLLGRGPTDKSGGAVDTQKDKGGLPALRGGFPDVGISIYEVGISNGTSTVIECSSAPWEQVTIMPLLGAISTLVTVLSWPLSSSWRTNLDPDFW